MPKVARKTPYFIERYVQCGEMPLYILFCRDKRGYERYCVMLCSHRVLRQLLRLKKGFTDPAQYGRLLVGGHGAEPNNVVKEILKVRYDFSLEGAHIQDVRHA